METKKSIVRTAIFKKEWNGKGIYEITFDNGDKGQYFSESKEQSAFKEGQEIEYTYEKKEKDGFTNYYVKPANQQRNGFNGGFPKGNPVYEHKRIALTNACNLASAGKIGLDKIGEYAGSFMKFLNE